jgi:hypothetical protein
MEEKLKKIESQLSLATADIGRAAIEANASLVVVYNHKKLFWSFNGLVQLAHRTPAALTLLDFCACVAKAGDPCKSRKTGNSFHFVARGISPEEAMKDL